MTLCLLYLVCLTLISFFTLFITDHSSNYPTVTVLADDYFDREIPTGIEQQNGRIIQIGSRINHQKSTISPTHNAKRRELISQ